MTQSQQPLNVHLEAEVSACRAEKHLTPWTLWRKFGETMGDIKVDQTADPMVEHPDHYNHGKLEVIDVLDAFGHLHFNLLNAIKYILRAPFKGRMQDLDKAIWYLQHMKELMASGEPGYYKRWEGKK